MECLDENTIAAYLEDSLQPAEAAAVAKHVDSCESCRTLLSAQVRCLPGATVDLDGGTDSLPVSWRYTVQGEYARGGQARILLAIDDTIGREVAVKELLPATPGEPPAVGATQNATRFLREARISGQLQHPGVVPVYEIGRKDDGQIYYTMQLVQGQTLSVALAARTNLSGRTGLLSHFLDLCNTIAYAHSRGVIHRDIKPQNVMVGEFGETVLLDWGLAKLRDTPSTDLPLRRAGPDPAGDGLKTLDGTSLGTPAYMSPEQAHGQVDAVDERSDIYCLGAVLYEFLTGRPPHQGRSLVEILDSAKDGEVRPVRDIEPGAPAELAAVAEKALQRDRAARYPSAQALSEEVTKYMTGERVAVYDYSPWDLLRRFAARHKIFLGAAVLVLAVIVAALVVVSFAYQQEAVALERAETEKAQALRESAVAAESRSRMLEARSKLRSSIEILDSASARALWSRLSRNPLLWKKDLGAMLYDLDFAPGGNWLAVASQARSVFLLRIDTQEMRVLSSDDQIMSLDISPDGSRLATGNWSGDVRIWDLHRDKLLHDLAGHAAKVWRVRFSPDGGHLASCSQDKTIRIWDVRRGDLVRELEPITDNPLGPGQTTSIAFAPDGRRLASLHGMAGAMVVWDWRKGTELAKLRDKPAYGSSVAFSPDSRRLATGHAYGNRTVRVWNVEAGELEFVLPHPGKVSRVAFSPDGRTLASAGYSGRLHLWDSSTGRHLRKLPGHMDSIDGLAFSPDGRYLATSGLDQTVRVWKLTGAPEEPARRGHAGDVRDADFDPRGERIGSVGVDSNVRMWDVATGVQLQVFKGTSAVASSVDFGPSGRRLVVGAWDGTLSVWDLEAGSRRVLGGSGFGPINTARFSPRGDLVATSSINTLAHIWDPVGGRERHILRGHSDQVLDVDFHPDGKRLASAGRDWALRIWDTRTGKQIDVHKASAALTGAAYTPDGRRIATVGEDGTLALWNPADGSSRVVGRHESRAYHVDCGPGGEHIGVAYADRTARIWDVATGDFVRLEGHRAEVNTIRFGPEGRRVVTTSDDDTVRVWDATTGRPFWRAPLLMATPPRLFSHRGWTRLDGEEDDGWPPASAWVAAVERDALTAAVGPDGRTLCLGRYDGHLEKWNLPGDDRTFHLPLPGITRLDAVRGGCLALADGRAVLVTGAGAIRELATRARATVLDRQEILVATEENIQVHDVSGDLLRRYPADRGVTVAARFGDRLLLGYENGTLFLTSDASAGKHHGFFFTGTPPSPVVRLLPGPMGTVAAGFADGHVGIWNLEDGFLLDQTRLHGAAIHLLLGGTRLFTASDLGDHGSIDLEMLRTPYCDLLRRVWDEIPVVWEGGRSRLRPTPTDHRCGAR